MPPYRNTRSRSRSVEPTFTARPPSKRSRQRKADTTLDQQQAPASLQVIEEDDDGDDAAEVADMVMDEVNGMTVRSFLITIFSDSLLYHCQNPYYSATTIRKHLADCLEVRPPVHKRGPLTELPLAVQEPVHMRTIKTKSSRLQIRERDKLGTERSRKRRKRRLSLWKEQGLQSFLDQ